MAKNRQDRISVVERQERIFVGFGTPSPSELQDSVPVFRKVGANVIQYIKIGNQIYQQTLTPIGT
jgi:hypothetical protein